MWGEHVLYGTSNNFAGVLIIVRNILSFHSFLHSNLRYFRGKRKKKGGMSINVEAVVFCRNFSFCLFDC